jgi:N-carbamoylputrescine amidase
LKNASVVRDAAKIGSRSDSLPELYSSHYFCQSEDVDNFVWQNLYIVLRLLLLALGKRIRRVIIVPLRKKNGGIYHNSAYIIDTDGSEADCTAKTYLPHF